ncbi:Fructosamine/Ketosamine-3-kinase [Penicillium verhagenii]|uniref:Fructosamine/Ketosamine-3-kinase n=1 Tax=Penicillium verhagenii TaxID=1562060 RepID=UPI002545869B|nr:Fructosamine/Ketosamine-3-kinase [Penicillium verhagenii]KAJ5921214.1 Fructosamine/Ketosamine-3-kinase [Penicillium verhagenii]
MTEGANSPTSQLDPAVLDGIIPKSERVISIEKHDTSSWAVVARINVKTTDDSPRAYFLKVCYHFVTLNLEVRGDSEIFLHQVLATGDAAERVLGEYVAMNEIYQTLPDFAPKPRGYGKCQNQEAHFFICDFLTISHNLPDPVHLGKKLAELHHKSQSPTGKFGFHCTTFDGKLPLNTTWDSNWTSFFTKLMRDVYQLDVEINGFWKELDDAMQITLERLIPRLLHPFTADGRSIKPCLIHGDLWESNIGTEPTTGEIYIYDACAYYAHHEKEVGIWRCEHHLMKNEVYRKEYFRNYEPSEPIEEADDRNRLYSVETLLINSAHFPGSQTRQRAVDELLYLINRFPGDSL